MTRAALISGPMLLVSVACGSEPKVVAPVPPRTIPAAFPLPSPAGVLNSPGAIQLLIEPTQLGTLPASGVSIYVPLGAVPFPIVLVYSPTNLDQLPAPPVGFSATDTAFDVKCTLTHWSGTVGLRFQFTNSSYH